MKIEMKLGRDTPGTHVFKNDDDDTPIKSLYITKKAIKGEVPKKITVSIPEIK